MAIPFDSFASFIFSLINSLLAVHWPFVYLVFIRSVIYGVRRFLTWVRLMLDNQHRSHNISHVEIHMYSYDGERAQLIQFTAVKFSNWKEEKQNQQHHSELNFSMFPISKSMGMFLLMLNTRHIRLFGFSFHSIFGIFASCSLCMFFCFFCQTEARNFLLKVYKASSNYFECWSCDSQMSPKMDGQTKNKEKLESH